MKATAAKRKLLYAATLAIFLLPLQSHADGISTGESIYQSVCKNCHGPTAKGMASFPKLAGNSAEYLTLKLRQYRAGEKVGSNTALMAPLAANLTDEDIASIAAYISSSFK